MPLLFIVDPKRLEFKAVEVLRRSIGATAPLQSRPTSLMWMYSHAGTALFWINVVLAPYILLECTAAVAS